ncbi:MAG: hypothetical protein ACKVN9_11460 [Methylophilaceae bacterium]
MENVMTDPEAPHGAKVQAAIAVLERSGIHHDIEANRIAPSRAPLNEMSLGQLQEFAAAGVARLAELKALRATQTIDAPR